jgi:hypothetical protein
MTVVTIKVISLLLFPLEVGIKQHHACCQESKSTQQLERISREGRQWKEWVLVTAALFEPIYEFVMSMSMRKLPKYIWYITLRLVRKSIKKWRTQCQKFHFLKQIGKCRFELPATSPNKGCGPNRQLIHLPWETKQTVATDGEEAVAWKLVSLQLAVKKAIRRHLQEFESMRCFIKKPS